MAFSYKPLWKLLIDKDIKQYELPEIAGFSLSTLNQLRRGNKVAMSVLEKLCASLNCRIEDIVEYKEGGKEND